MSQDKPLSPQEIVDNAADWTLAHDVGLLKYLEQFSEKLLKDASDTNDNLDNLLNNLENASLSLDIARNTFMSLSNVQFIEKRVYDDDETLPIVEKTEPIEKRQTEDERINEMKSAVLRGLDVVDKYFDKVEVVASDSEDDADFPCFVLQPKDPYINRPLPYVIGSEKWHAKLHVGLAESSDESEDEKASEKYSDSDLESDLPTTNRSQVKTPSESESEDLGGGIRQPAANSTFDGTKTTTGGDDFNSAAQRTLISQNNFAVQLAAKLDSVIGKNNSAEPEINKKPIQKPSSYNYDLFSNEPPPLDVVDEAQPKSGGLFSGGDGLFDNLDDDESFWGEKTVNYPKTNDDKIVPNLFDDDEIGEVVPSKVVNKSQQLQSKGSGAKVETEKIGDLFDDDSDDELFTGVQRSVNRNKTDASNSDDPSPKSKAPIGGKLPFGNVNLLTGDRLEGALKNRRRLSPDDTGNQNNQTDNARSVDKAPSNETKPQTASDDLFGAPNPKPSKDKAALAEDLFGDFFTDAPKEFTSTLFDDHLQVNDESDLFGSNVDKGNLFSDVNFSKVTNVTKEPKGLFDDDDDEDLFASGTKHKANSKPAESSSSKLLSGGLFEDLFSPNGEYVQDEFQGGSTNLFDEKANLKNAGKGPNDLFASNVVVEKESGVQQVGDSDDVVKPDLVEVTEEEKDYSDDKRGSEARERPAEKASKSDENTATKQSAKQGRDSPRIHSLDENLPDLFANPTRPRDSFEDLFSMKPTSSGDSFDKDGLFLNDDDLFSFGDANKETKSASDGFLGPGDVKVANISLFDPVPPPDLDDWDSRSENNLFDDDQFLFENVEDVATHRSSIFDNEPPSLLYNELSGIVGDQVARVESDDSSFDRYASSSSRFSAERNEEISGDFSVTKNLGDVLEAVDLKEDGAVSLCSETVGEVEPAKKYDGASKDRTSFEKKTDSSPAKPKIGEKPKAAQISRKENEKGQEVQPNDVDESATGSPGKLKHNLNINVKALLPGAAPPRRPVLAKSQSLDLAQREAVATPEASTERIEESYEASDAKDATKSVEVLQSVTKDRARIAVKRRPSTRKGREAIRKSCIDLTFDPTKEETTGEARVDPIDGDDKTPPISELASPSTPTAPEEKPDVDAENAEIKSTNLFGESDDDDDLFASVKPKHKMDGREIAKADVDVKKPALLSVDDAKFDGARRTSFVKTDNFETPDLKQDLFDEDDDDKDIFSAKRLPPKSDFLNRNMFDDEDDEMFWTSSATSVAKITTKRSDVKVTDRKPKVTVPKKLDNAELLYDPLDALKK